MKQKQEISQSGRHRTRYADPQSAPSFFGHLVLLSPRPHFRPSAVLGSICFFTVKGDALFPKTPTPLPIFGCEFQTISNVLFREKRLFAQRSPRRALLFQQPLGAPEGDLLAFPLPQREFERHFVAQKTKVAPQPFKRREGPSCPIRATIGGSPLKRPNAYAGGAAPCTLSKVFV